MNNSWDMEKNWWEEKSQREPAMCPTLILQVNEVYKIQDK